MRLQALLVLALLAALLCAAAPLRVSADDFDAELARAAPELAEHAAHEFHTLTDMGEQEDPAASFAEMQSEEHSEVEHNDEEAAQEEEAQEGALLETAAEAEADSTAHKAKGGKSKRSKGGKSKRSKSGKSSKKAAKSDKPWHRDDNSQPISRNNAEITCLDGDCTRATKVKKAKIGDHPSQHTKPPPGKLDIALGAVKEEIMVRAKELRKEKVWAGKVSSLIDVYQQKLHKVSANIVELRVQTKALLRKKKQIENVKVQGKLRNKLKLAQADLNRLQKQMEHIAGKENEFADTEKQLKGTMNALKNSLLKLRGQEPKRLEAEGIELP